MDQQEILARREEKYFFELFHTALIFMEGGYATDEEVEIGIERSMANFIGGPNSACAVNNFQTYGDQLGYFYWSSPVSAGVTRKEVLTAIQRNQAFRSYFAKPSLKMVSVGGGTGSDLVGMYSAIYEYFTYQEQQSIFRSMEVSLMDYNINWEKFFRKVDYLLRHTDTDFGNASHLMKNRNRNITTSFIEADLRKLSHDLEQKLATAQIVWMKGVQAILDNDEDRERVVENIVSLMDPEALLVVLDSPFYIDRFVESNNRLRKIFETEGSLPYVLEPFPDLQIKFQHCKQTNQKLRIFKKISEK